MQNTYNKTSAAYDFALFETSPEKELPEKKEQAELKIVQASVSKTGKPVLIWVSAVFVFILFFMFIYSKAMLSEVNLRISNETQALQEAQSVNNALSAQLSGSVSLDNVEEYAQKELGMQKINAAQEKYIEMNTGTMTETAKTENENIFVGISNWFNGILEYLGF